MFQNYLGLHGGNDGHQISYNYVGNGNRSFQIIKFYILYVQEVLTCYFFNGSRLHGYTVYFSKGDFTNFQVHLQYKDMASIFVHSRNLKFSPHSCTASD